MSACENQCSCSDRALKPNSCSFKVLLVYPYCTSRETSGRWYSAEPLGLLYIATFLAREAKKAGIPLEIKLLDAQMEGGAKCLTTSRGYRNGMTDEAIKEAVSAYQPSVVGICMNYTFGAQDALEVASLVKQACPTARVVMGGAHATLAHLTVAENAAVDAVVRGEGEVSFQELCFALQQGRGFGDLAGLTYRANGGVKENPARASIEDLDALPIPDRSFLSYERYLANPGYFHTMQAPVGTVFTARGCPFHCVFCSTQKTWGNNWRSRSAESMIEEVEYLHREYGVKEIAFQDDQFLGDRQRIIKFCKLVVQKNLGMTFIVPPGNSPALMNVELLDWMAKAGFYRLCFSVDAGTDAAVRYVRKPVKLSNIRSLVKAAAKRGIWTYGTFVIGFPYEKKEDIEATIRYAYSLKLDFLRFYIVQPYFGSDLYDRYKAEGRLDGLKIGEQHSQMDSFFGTDHLSAKELIDLRNQAECGYIKNHWRDFLNPIYLYNEFLPKLTSWRRLKYFMGLARQFSEVTLKFTKTETITPEPPKTPPGGPSKTPQIATTSG